MRELNNQKTAEVFSTSSMAFLQDLAGEVQTLGAKLPYGEYQAKFINFLPAEDNQGCNFVFNLEGLGEYTVSKSWRKDLYTQTAEDVRMRMEGARKFLLGLFAQEGIYSGMRIPDASVLKNKTFTIASLSFEVLDKELDCIEVINCVTSNPTFIADVKAKTNGTFVQKLDK